MHLRARHDPPPGTPIVCFDELGERFAACPGRLSHGQSRPRARDPSERSDLSTGANAKIANESIPDQGENFPDRRFKSPARPQKIPCLARCEAAETEGASKRTPPAVYVNGEPADELGPCLLGARLPQRVEGAPCHTPRGLSYSGAVRKKSLHKKAGASVGSSSTTGKLGWSAYEP